MKIKYLYNKVVQLYINRFNKQNISCNNQIYLSLMSFFLTSLT